MEMSTLSDGDVKFLQAMVDHHDEAVKMVKQYFQTSLLDRNPLVTSLASEITTTQAAQIKQMKDWLTKAGKPTTGGDDDKYMMKMK